MPVIANEYLEVSILEKGAELDSVYHKQLQQEYMWNANPAFWAKKSPILFPIVGTLKDDTYWYEGKSYKLGRHGFAREMDFVVTSKSDTTITFTLNSNEKTKANYPFDFRFDITYSLSATTLDVSYKVTNTANQVMYFSVGGHPAFRIPIVEGDSYSDYYLEFDEKENAGRWPISKDGLIETQPTPLLENNNRIKLTKDLFIQDALVFKNMESNAVSIRSTVTERGLHFDFTGFPFLGIWAAKQADFVCIEPWCGIADSVNTNQQLIDKEGIIKLVAGSIFERTWKLTVF